MLEINRLRKEDVSELARLEKEIFGENAWSEKDFLDTLDLPYAYYLVIREDGELIASCGLRNMCSDADITNVMVSPSKRRRGIGEWMLKTLMEEARSIGVINYSLEVRSRNIPARRLYEKLGFIEEGIRKDFYTNPRDDALILWNRDWNTL